MPNFCAQQCVDEGVGLCSRHNLHRPDHMKNGKQHTAYSQLTEIVPNETRRSSNANELHFRRQSQQSFVYGIVKVTIRGTHLFIETQ